VDSEGSRLEQFARLVWYNESRGERQTLVADALVELEAAGMPRQNSSRFLRALAASPKFVPGRALGSVRLVSSESDELSRQFGAERRQVPTVFQEFVSSGDLPQRKPFLKVAEQLNGCYELGFYDAAATMARRLLEMLLIEIYIGAGRSADVKRDGSFLMLDGLVTKYLGDSSFSHGRNLAKDFAAIKAVGDSASHDRSHISTRSDLDGIAFQYRRTVSALLGYL